MLCGNEVKELFSVPRQGRVAGLVWQVNSRKLRKIRCFPSVLHGGL